MASRALIIAIEEYPESTVTSDKLPGTIANAEKFAEWLENEMKLPGMNIAFCASGDSSKKTAGGTRAEIKTAILELLQAGQNETESLFVYVSGHGLSKTKPDFDEDSDVLLCAEFRNDEMTGDACIPLGELMTLLSGRLGPGNHYWFVDMCRSSSKAIIPGTLGIKPEPSDTGTAKWFQLLSAESGQAAATDSKFIDALIASLNGDCVLVEDESQTGSYVITFLNVAKGVSVALAAHGRTIATRMKGTEDAIRIIHKAGLVDTIAGPGRTKVPPIQLLVAHDEVVFLGETNGQLPTFMEQAFAERSKRWKRIDVLSIEDLSTAHRGDKPFEDLKQERAKAEQFLKEKASSMCQELSLYRYDYAGTYGSLWTASDGTRRAHASARLAGQNIRTSPASDYVDFPLMRDPIVNSYFELAQDAITEANKIFSYP